MAFCLSDIHTRHNFAAWHYHSNRRCDLLTCQTTHVLTDVSICPSAPVEALFFSLLFGYRRWGYLYQHMLFPHSRFVFVCLKQASKRIGLAWRQSMRWFSPLPTHPCNLLLPLLVCGIDLSSLESALRLLPCLPPTSRGTVSRLVCESRRHPSRMHEVEYAALSPNTLSIIGPANLDVYMPALW